MINWSEIDVVLLDMDGTLLDLHFDNYFWLEFLPERYAAHHDCSLEAAQLYLSEMSDKLHGSLEWYCLDHWTDLTGLDILALKHEVSHMIRFRPDAPMFLEFLQEIGKQLTLVTNAHPQAMTLKMQASGLDRYIGHCISSHNLQLAKENPGFWKALQQEHNLDYERCLFIDDSAHVLRQARHEGLSRILQVLHPDTSRQPASAGEFPGIVHFQELINS